MLEGTFKSSVPQPPRECGKKELGVKKEKNRLAKVTMCVKNKHKRRRKVEARLKRPIKRGSIRK